MGSKGKDFLKNGLLGGVASLLFGSGDDTETTAPEPVVTPVTETEVKAPEMASSTKGDNTTSGLGDVASVLSKKKKTNFDNLLG